jgi:hypothetical protein
MKAIKPIYYPDPVIFEKERLIYVRFDGQQSPATFNVPYYFANDDVLKNKIITGIESKTTAGRFTTGASAVATDIGFIGQLLNNASLAYFTITLVGKNGETILNDCPLMEFNVVVTSGKIRRTSMMIDLSKSFIRNFGYNSLNSNSVIPICFYYKDK